MKVLMLSALEHLFKLFIDALTVEKVRVLFHSPLELLLKLLIDALMIEKVKVIMLSPLEHLFKLLIDAAREGLHLLIHHNVVLVARIPENYISLHKDKA